MSAKFKTETVEVTTTVEKKVGVILELTLEEAVTLTDILHLVGGSPDTTARKYATSVLNKLWALDVYNGNITAQDGCIYYNEGSLKQVQKEVERLQK